MALALRNRPAVLLPNGHHRLFNESRKIRVDSVRNTKHQFHRGIAKPPLDQTEHGFGHAGTLGDRILGKVPALPLFSQQPDNLAGYRFVMSDSGHVEALQEKRLDSYFAMVKYRDSVPT